MKIRIGDYVSWRGAWGSEHPKKAKVEGIDLCEREGEKYGIPVNEIFLKDKNRSVFSLDNGHWAYGYQIDPIEE